MSSNNQTLVQEYKGRWYVFSNVQAESWCDDNLEHRNELSLKGAVGSYQHRLEALGVAMQVDEAEGTEYGVWERLAKDGEMVVLIE